MKLLKPEQVADIFGVPVKAIHKLCRYKIIDHIQVTSKQRAFTPDQIQEFIERRTVKATDSGRERESCDPNRSGDSEITNHKPQDRNKVVDLISLKKEMKQW